MWIRRGEIVAPELIRVGKSFIRVWTLDDIEQAKKIQRHAEDRTKAKEQKVMALFRAMSHFEIVGGKRISRHLSRL